MGRGLITVAVLITACAGSSTGEHGVNSVEQPAAEAADVAFTKKSGQTVDPTPQPEQQPEPEPQPATERNTTPLPESSTPPMRATKVHLYRWEPASADVHGKPRQVAFKAGLHYPPSKGDRYLVLRKNQPAQEGRVVELFKIKKACDYCGLSTHYFIIELDETNTGSGSPFALGPVSALPEEAKPSLIDPSQTSLRPLRDVKAAVDLDGNGDADVTLLTSRGECPGLPLDKPTLSPCDFMGTYCEKRMARTAAGWQIMEQRTRPLCIHNGHN